MGEALVSRCAGSNTKLFDFPLSIQTAEPAPLGKNHIWIMSSEVLPVVVSNTVKDLGYNYYCLKENDIDQLCFKGTVDKKTTTGVKVSFVLDKSNKPTIPEWQLSEASKSNPLNVFLNYPIVYSNKNNIVDIENAKYWTGTEWKWLSQKGRIVYIGRNVYTVDGEYNFNFETILPYSIISGSKDGRVIITESARADNISIYLRNGFSYNLLQNINYPYVGTYYRTSISEDGLFICLSVRSNTTYGVNCVIYKFNHAIQQYESFQNISFDGNSTFWGKAAISPNGRFLAMSECFCQTNSDGGFVRLKLYKYNGDKFELLHTEIVDTSNSSKYVNMASSVLAWSGDSLTVFAAHYSYGASQNILLLLDKYDNVSVGSSTAIGSASGPYTLERFNYSGDVFLVRYYSSNMASPKYNIRLARRSGTVLSNLSNFSDSSNEIQFVGVIDEDNILLRWVQGNLYVYKDNGKNYSLITTSSIPSGGEIFSSF